jgi:hypothetical protein
MKREEGENTLKQGNAILEQNIQIGEDNTSIENIQ